MSVAAPRRGALRRLSREPDLSIGLALLAFVLIVVAFPQAFTDASPTQVNVDKAMEPPSGAHPFGADDVGRDILARVVFGARVTLSICAGALMLSALVGGALGLMSGFLGGRLDMALGRLVDVVLSFPPIVLGVMVTGVLGPTTTNLVLALAVVYMPVFFRVARAGAISEAGLSYVEAARSIGLAEGHILFRHVARNVAPLVLVQYVILFPLVLQIQAALGFLGLGVQPPTPDWGAILQQAKDYIFLAPWMSAFPGMAILVTALALALVGRALQRRLDAR